MPVSASAESELSCRRVPELMHIYLQKHISFHYVNDDLRQRLIDRHGLRGLRTTRLQQYRKSTRQKDDFLMGRADGPVTS